MKIVKNLDEFVKQFRAAPNLQETGEGLLAAFGSITFVYQKEEGPIKNEKHVVDLSAEDVCKIVRALEAEN